MPIDVTYPAIVDLIHGHGMTVKQQSRQLLVWFLLNHYRLGDTEADDSVCDETDDKGVDGVYVNDNSNEIVVLSSKLRTGSPLAQLGHGELKELAGTIAQFRTPEGVQQLIDTTKNDELKALLRDRQIVDKVTKGYTIRGVLVSNGDRNGDAANYLKLTPEIELFDGQRLINEYVAVDEIAPVDAPVTFNLSVIKHVVDVVDSKTMVVAAMPAQELIRLDGIKNEQLFAPNVRQWLGVKTNVNQALEKSIIDDHEHRLFPAYHNGLTILCETLDIKGDNLTINGYGVANGCQSLRGFYEKQAFLTGDLRVWVKFINEKPGTLLAQKITDHTNNQNGISARDLKSNQLLQTRLQTEINDKYGGEVYFRIKRGEHPEWPKSAVLENQLAGRILLAFKEKKPEASHQVYKVFEDLYEDIFGGVTGDQVVILYDAYRDILAKLELIGDQRFIDNINIAEYSQTPFLVLDFMRALLETDEKGRQFLTNMSEFRAAPNGRARINKVLGEIAQAVLRLLNGEINRRQAPDEHGNPSFFDYKREFKSPRSVATLREQIKTHYRIALDGKLYHPFSVLWSNSEALTSP